MQNNKRIIEIKDARSKQIACTTINALAYNPVYEVEVRKKKKRNQRKLSQQALMWIWHKQWAEHFGNTDTSEHIRFKQKYLLPILIRENVKEGLGDLYLIAAERMRMNDDFRAYNALCEMISTTWLDVTQFAEMLRNYQHDTADLGLLFTTKNEHYERAMRERPTTPPDFICCR